MSTNEDGMVEIKAELPQVLISLILYCYRLFQLSTNSKQFNATGVLYWHLHGGHMIKLKLDLYNPFSKTLNVK